MTDLDEFPWRITEDSTVWDPNALELDLIADDVNWISARILQFRNRFAGIFREFDGLHAEVATVRAELAALDRKLDLVLAALPTTRD